MAPHALAKFACALVACLLVSVLPVQESTAWAQAAVSTNVSVQGDGPELMLALVQQELDQTGSANVVVMFDIDQAISRLGGPPAHRALLSQSQAISLALSGLRSFLVSQGLNTTEAVTFHSLPALVLTVHSVGEVDVLQSSPFVASIVLEGSGGSVLNNETREIVGANLSSAQGFEGSGVRIAVLDSGIDSDHPDFSGALVHEACFVERVDGLPGCVGNRFVAIGPGTAEDDYGHGTNVTGVIASNGTVAPRGVAPGVEIEAIKVIDDQGIFAASSQLTKGLDHILTFRPDVDVVNVSAGTSAQFSGACDSTFPAMSSAINELRERGVIVVASANNMGSATMGAPACLSNVMAVGATYDNPELQNFDTYATFSSISEMTDVAAPGGNVTTSHLSGQSIGNRYGTSFSSGVVSACIAVLISQGYSGVAAIEDRIKQSPTYVGRNGFFVPRIDCSPLVGSGLAGDMNCDGIADDGDLRAVLEYLVGTRRDGGACPLSDTSTELYLVQADQTNDGAVTLLDALLLAQD